MPSHTTNRLMFAGATLAGAAVAALALPVAAGVGVGAAAAGLAGSLIGGISANFLHQCTDDLAKALANSPGYSKDYLRNEDLRRLVGETVAAKLKALASDTSLDGAARDRLEVLALKATEGWLTVADHASLQKLNEDVVTRLFAMSSKNFANATALDAPTWADFLTYLDSTITDASIAEKIKRIVTPGRAIGAAPLTPAVRLSIGATLAKEFPHALAIAAKRAFESNDPAYAALQLRLMRDLMTDVRDILATVSGTADKVDALFVGQTGMQAQLTAIAAAVQAKAPAVGKAVPAASAHDVQDILDEIAASHKQVMGALARIEAHTALLPGMDAKLDLLTKGQHATATLQSVTNFLALGLTRNPVFTGREAEMLSLRSAMFPTPTAGKNTAPRASALTQSFTGEGGIGKSQLAQRFAETACAALRDAGEAAEAGWDLFDCVWWLDASAERHAQAVRTLAEHLGHAPTPQDTPATLRAAVRTKLDKSKRHLLILDNLDELDDAAMKAQGEETRWARAEGWSLPPGSRLLMTTRSQNLPERFAACVKLGVLSVEDARALLRGAREDLRDTGRPETDSALRDALDAVTAHLGRLALAVDMARAWLHLHPGRTPGTLLQELRESDAAAISLFEADELKEEAHRYRLSVAAALSLHMNALACTPAERLLTSAAFAAPDRIPAELLRTAAGVDGKEADEGLRQLHAKSIVHHQPGPDGGLVSLHRLTQMVVRARLTKAETEGTARVLAAWLKAIYALHRSYDHDEVRPKRTAAAAHVAAVADRALEDATVTGTRGDAAVCLHKNADHYLLIGALADSEAAINKAVRWAESGGPKVMRDLMIFLASRAIIRQNRGDLGGAEADLQASIDWFESQSSCGEWSLAICYASRAGIRQARGDLAGAEDDIQTSIDWGESQSVPDERRLAGWYGTRAVIRMLRGDLVRAEADIQTSIDWSESQAPCDGRTLAIDYASRAHIRQLRDDLAGAEADIQKSIDWEEAQTQPNPRELAIRYSLRATIRQDRGDLAGAEADIQAGIDWGESQSPRDERNLAVWYSSRADIRRSRGDLAGAEDDIQKCVDWRESHSPRDERSLSICYGSRALIRLRRGDITGAEADLQASIDWEEAQAQPNQRDLAIRYSTRVFIRLIRGDLTGAEADIQRSIEWEEAQSPRNDASLSARYFQRATLRRLRGNLAEAEADIQKSIDWHESQFPRNERGLALDYGSRAQIREGQAVAARNSGDMSKADALFTQAKDDIGNALTWFEKNLQTDKQTIALMREDKARIEKAERGGP